MTKHSLYTDSRGSSFQIGTILTLAILTILVGGVITATGAFVRDTQADAIDQELEVVGERIAAEIMAADRLSRTGYRSDVVFTADVPRRVGGSQYTVAIKDQPGQSAVLILRSSNPEVTVETPFRHTTPIAENSVPGDSIRIVYTSSNELTLERDTS